MSKDTALVKRAARSAVVPALIQNGSDPTTYSETGSQLVQRAARSAVVPALIQNGSDPTTYSEAGASVQQG